MDDLYVVMKRLKNDAYGENEILLSYAIDSWLNSQPPSSVEGMADLESILKQYERGKSIVINKQVEECLFYIHDWFQKWNGRS